MKPYPNEELDRMSKREIIRLYKRTVEQFSDAVPVVRCEQCTWRNMGECMFWSGEGMYTEDNDYCSRGKRKEE